MCSLIKMFRDVKGQGALEYLLIIAGAIVVVAIVVAISIKSSDQGKDTLDNTQDDFNSFVGGEMEKLKQEGGVQ